MNEGPAQESLPSCIFSAWFQLGKAYLNGTLGKQPNTATIRHSGSNAIDLHTLSFGPSREGLQAQRNRISVYHIDVLAFHSRQTSHVSICSFQSHPNLYMEMTPGAIG